MQTNISEIAVFTMKEVFGPFFLVLSSVTNLKGLFSGVHKLIWQLLWNLFKHFSRTSEVVENTKFWKKGNISSEEKILADFLAQYRLQQLLVNTL